MRMMPDLTINAVGAPPEKHANRIVAEMLRLIARERPALITRIQQAMATMPDGNPKAQQKLTRKVQDIGGLLTPTILLTPGKRGRYTMNILGIDSWNAETKRYIEWEKDPIPDKPWLACSITRIDSNGNHRYDEDRRKMLLVTHHALSRLAQRHRAKTANDLLIAVNNIIQAYLGQMRGKDDLRGWIKSIKDGTRLKFDLNDTLTAAAVINNDPEDGLVVVTIV